MGNRLFIMMIFLGMLSFPHCLIGSDIFGNFTYQGKAVDADTLKPIEGAVVVAKWYKCWPGIGAGTLCDFSMAEEALTDANGEWRIKGPEGTWTPSLPRAILGFIVRWTEPPSFMIYKPGYHLYGKYGQWSGYEFRAIPYENKENGLSGIALERPSTMRKELIELDIDYNNEVPLILTNNPVSRLKRLDFPFRYCGDIMKISQDKLNYPWCQYWVVGLKKTLTKQEWKEERIYPGSLTEWEYMPLLRKAVEEDFRNPVRFD